jgi:hypothetical protein
VPKKKKPIKFEAKVAEEKPKADVCDLNQEPLTEDEKKAHAEKMNMKLHWYVLSYLGMSTTDGKEGMSSVYAATSEKKVTGSLIERMKEHARVLPKAMLTSASYLGFMTAKEFQGLE